ncbi:tRNA (adenine-N1)-methyltransferase [Bifidobacterium xylocopae]|uniref:tRNA (adenine-N1)-methyltransferase n=1 Tax=Bifidobacterium xylocopae TaxID=2493119 RepID=UPI0022AA63C6|nr:tRNA (adenine-N1)-methyltransferase [Bifidobacterium xylocopae]
MTAVRRGPLRAGEKVQLTDRKGKKLTIMLKAGAVTQTDRGFLAHDRLIGLSEGSVVTTLSAQGLAERKSGERTDGCQPGIDRSVGSESAAHATDGQRKGAGSSDGPVVPRASMTNGTTSVRDPRKPWKESRAVGGWAYVVMRPRMADFVLSMPRGAQIMYPKDIAQVLSVGDISTGMRVLESGAGSGAMSLSLLDAVGPAGSVTTIELRPEFARVAQGNATVYFGGPPAWWDLRTGDFDSLAPQLAEGSYDRAVLDQLDPWNRLSGVRRALTPGGILTAYVTTTTQLSRLAEALRESGSWTEPEISETMERGWKADGLAVRPQHQMIGHTGFLVVSRAMAPGFAALRRREHGTKDTHADIDTQVAGASGSDGLAALELRDISDRKLRKVLRDLESQEAQVAATGNDRPERDGAL